MSLHYTEEERVWHTTRRAFVFHDNRLRLNAEGSDLGHREWFAAEGWDAAYENDLRGFFDFTGVYLYKGPDYRFDLGDRDTARRVVRHLACKRDVPAGLPVFGGMHVREWIGRWPTRERLPFDTLGTQLTFGVLCVGERFIGFPTPGDDSGHGGFLSGSFLFEKVNETAAVRLVDEIESTFPHAMAVLQVLTR